jgi:hypothetical protein
MIVAKIALQVILGLIFLFTGTIKITTPKEKLESKGVTGFEDISSHMIKYLALAEITGAMVLLIFSIPALPQLPIKIAAVGFAILMIAASGHHWTRKEYKNMIATTFLLATCITIWFLL